MKRSEFVDYLEKILKSKKYKEDIENNMLIVKGKNEIKKIGLATNSSWETLKKAKLQKIDFLIVHHRIWKGKDPEFFNKKLYFLKKNKISLYGAHESMDCIEDFGMADSIAKELGMNVQGRFCRFGAGYAGIYGTTKLSYNAFIKKLEKILETKVKVFKYAKKLKKIGIVTGMGGRPEWMFEAKKLGCDTFISGESVYFSKLYAKEGRLNLILGGHYPTEMVGMKHLRDKIKEDLNLNAVFLKEEDFENI